MNRPSTYAVWTTDDGSNPGAGRKLVTFQGPKEALDYLRNLRAEHHDNGGFIVPNTVAERDAFPYRNKIGPLRPNDSNHWGYRFQVPETADVISMWIEKQDVGEGHRTLKEDLEDEAVVGWAKECDYDYVVYSSVQDELDQAHSRHYDEDKRDFVFDGELEEEVEEQVLVIRQGVGNSAQKNVGQKDAEQNDIEKKDTEKKAVEQKDVEQKDAEQKDVEQKDTEQQDGQSTDQ
ncbi:hypothetical protein MBLNU13_g02612t1 [Cladosporium sp. NU13]